MNRMVMGALVALLLVAAGMFWWQGRAELQSAAPPPDISGGANHSGRLPNDAPIELPSANPHARGGPLPSSAAAKLSKEEKRFNRYDKNRDGRITRNEMLSTRVKAFQKLDTNHDNILSFEEWAVKTSDRFKEIDTNHDGVITPAELAAYAAVKDAKKARRKPGCSSPRERDDSHAGENNNSEGEGGEPTQ